MLVVAFVTAALIAVSVTFDAQDPDLWHHLAVGRHIWQHHEIPRVELWTWPAYGTPYVNYAWGFEALVWPFWSAGGVAGLFVWRWLMTLATFALGYAAARSLGARNLVSFPVAVLCAMVFRSHSLVRPEGIAAVLLAGELLWLSMRRGGARPSPLIMLTLAWVWANTHLTYYWYLFILGAHVLARLLPGRERDPREARILTLIGVASGVVMIANPFGWQYLWEPIATWQRFRGDAIVQNIGELMPVDWHVNWRNGLPLIVAGWPALALIRAYRKSPDWAELVLCAGFCGQLLLGQRFLAVLALVAFPYMSRDLAEWWRGVETEGRGWIAQSSLAAAGCVALALPELVRVPLGVRLTMTTYSPVAACDFIDRNDLHGPLYNPYGLGGYLVYRFAESRQRLPFISIHLHGDRQMRQLYMMALTGQQGWKALYDRFPFEVLILWQNSSPTDELPMVLDRDTTWARVFNDDVACVYVRRNGPYAQLARDSAYVALPADPRNIAALGPRVESDSAFRQVLGAELRRQISSSPEHSNAALQLAFLANAEHRYAEAESLLKEAIRIRPHRAALLDSAASHSAH